MPPRDARAFLADIRDACRGIVKRTSGVSLEDYKSDESLRLICERLLGIVGEAISQLRTHSPGTLAKITDVDRIVGFRNIVIHGYYALVHDIVWTIVTTDVPRLLLEAEALLEESRRKNPGTDPDLFS